MADETAQEDPAKELTDLLYGWVQEDTASFYEGGKRTTVSHKDYIEKSFQETLDKMSEYTGISKDKLTPEEIEGLRIRHAEIENAEIFHSKTKAFEMAMKYCPEECKEFMERVKAGSAEKEELSEMAHQIIEKTVKAMARVESVGEELDTMFRPSKNYIEDKKNLHREMARSFDDDNKPVKERLEDARQILKDLESNGMTFADKEGQMSMNLPEDKSARAR